MAHINPIQIQKFLKGVDYPASKQALIDNAKNLGADENVCASLEQLPDEDFQTPADVSQAFGKMADEPDRQASGSGSNEFLGQACEDAMAHVELCELALQKSGNDEIKVFAQQMIDEHGQMGAEIEQLARSKKVVLPKDLESKHKAALKEMSGLQGAEFDSRFMQHHVQEHENDLKVFRHYAEQESDADVRKLAEKGVRMLDKHLQMARDIGKRLAE